jgi:hypothetical protein
MTTGKDSWWRKKELTLAQTTSDNLERNNTRQTLAHPSKWWQVLKLNFKASRKISPDPGVWKSLRAVVFATCNSHSLNLFAQMLIFSLPKG